MAEMGSIKGLLLPVRMSRSRSTRSRMRTLATRVAGDQLFPKAERSFRYWHRPAQLRGAKRFRSAAVLSEVKLVRRAPNRRGLVVLRKAAARPAHLSAL